MLRGCKRHLTEADAPSEYVIAAASEVFALEPDDPLFGKLKGRRETQEGAASGTARSPNGNELARFDLERDVSDGDPLQATTPIARRDMLKREEAQSCSPPSPDCWAWARSSAFA